MKQDRVVRMADWRKPEEPKLRLKVNYETNSFIFDYKPRYDCKVLPWRTTRGDK